MHFLETVLYKSIGKTVVAFSMKASFYSFVVGSCANHTWPLHARCACVCERSVDYQIMVTWIAVSLNKRLMEFGCKELSVMCFICCWCFVHLALMLCSYTVDVVSWRWVCWWSANKLYMYQIFQIYVCFWDWEKRDKNNWMHSYQFVFKWLFTNLNCVRNAGGEDTVGVAILQGWMLLNGWWGYLWYLVIFGQLF